MNSLDDYRHKLVDKVINAESCEQVKRYLVAAVGSLEKQEVGQLLISRFIDKSINQLTGLGLLETGIKAGLNIQYAKAQLEITKRNVEKGKAGSTNKLAK